jgi:hypothetical protein
MILHGIAKGIPTAQMARELGCDRKELLTLRHRLQERARIGLDRNPLDDAVVEADEMYQNAGEKRTLLAERHHKLTRLDGSAARKDAACRVAGGSGAIRSPRF